MLSWGSGIVKWNLLSPYAKPSKYGWFYLPTYQDTISQLNELIHGKCSDRIFRCTGDIARVIVSQKLNAVVAGVG